MILPVEIIQVITDYLEYKYATRVRISSKLFYDYIKYYSLYIDNDEHEYPPLDPYIKKIIVNRGVTRQIDISAAINLQYLTFVDYPYSINLNNCKNLRVLCVVGCRCKIGDDDIKDLRDILLLNAEYNPNITTVNHLKKLKVLFANGDCSITDDGIQECTELEQLDVSDNQNISHINHLTKLQILHADGESGVDDESLIGLNNLQIISCIDNTKITNLYNLPQLKQIRIAPNHIINL